MYFLIYIYSICKHQPFKACRFLYVPPGLTIQILDGARVAMNFLYRSQNRQRLLLRTSLTDWSFFKPWWKVFTARYGLIPYIKQITFRLQNVTTRTGSYEAEFICETNFWVPYTFGGIQEQLTNLTFRGPRIVIYSYNKTNEMH